MADNLDYELTEIKRIVSKQRSEFSEENADTPLLAKTPENGTPTGSTASSQQTNPDTKTESCLWKPVRLIQRRHGLVLAVLSPCFFSGQSACLDVLTETLDPFQVVLMYAPVMVFCCSVVILWTNVRPPSCRDYKQYFWLMLSSASQTLNSCIFTLVLSYLTIGDAVTIVYTSVIHVGFFSWLVLKEPMRLFDIIFAILACAGVVFIARPPFIFGSDEDDPAGELNLIGVLLAFAASCTGALLMIFNRKLSTLGATSSFCLFFNSLVVFITSGVICVILNNWKCPNLTEWLIAIIAGVVYFLGHVTLFFSLKAERATLVNVIFTGEIVLAFIWQIFLLGVLPPWTSYIGASLVLGACIGITLKNKPQASDEEGTNEGEKES